MAIHSGSPNTTLPAIAAWLFATLLTMQPALAAEDAAACKAPEFSFEQFHPKGLLLVAKAEPDLALRVRVVPSSEEPVSGEELWDVTVKATKDGGRVNLPFDPSDGSEELEQIYERNGWVTLVYQAVEKDDCDKRKAGQVTTPALERHVLAIDAGTVMAMAHDGDFEAQPEFAIAAMSRWAPLLSGFVDIRYSFIAQVAEEEPSESGEGDDEGTAEANGDDDTGADDLVNPFESAGGTLEANLYLALHPFKTPSFGLVVGAGFSTLPDEKKTLTRARVFVGPRFEVFGYNTLRAADVFGRTTGFVQFGLARDDLWEWDEAVPDASDGASIHHDERDRWFLEAQMKLGNTPGDPMSWSPRIYADLPTSGDGPSDVRISILASVNLQRLVALFPG